MQTIASRVLVGALALTLSAAFAQSSGTEAQTTRSGTSTGTRAAQSDSSDWQQTGKSEDAPTSKPARTDQATTTGDDFDTLDTDHDGRISRAEAGASQDFSGRFKTLDTDNDGYVSSAEYREGLRATRTPPATH